MNNKPLKGGVERIVRGGESSGFRDKEGW